MIPRKVRSVGLFVFILALFGGVAPSSFAALANPEPFIVEQPDGSFFWAKQTGDEWVNTIETLDGYTIIRDKTTGYS